MSSVEHSLTNQVERSCPRLIKRESPIVIQLGGSHEERSQRLDALLTNWILHLTRLCPDTHSLKRRSGLNPARFGENVFETLLRHKNGLAGERDWGSRLTRKSGYDRQHR